MVFRLLVWTPMGTITGVNMHFKTASFEVQIRCGQRERRIQSTEKTNQCRM